MALHNELGKRGEVLATEFLISNGHKILALNWRFGKKELDIISFYGYVIHFTEVKTRAEMYDDPSDLISRNKQKFLLDIADVYLQAHHIENEAKFNLIFVLILGEKHKIEFFEDAFNARL